MADTAQSSLVFSPSVNPVVDEYHGVSIPDPYRWLEQLELPETRSWIVKQRKATAAFFEQQPSYEAIRRQFDELWRFPKYSVPFKRGAWRFCWGQDEFQPQAVLYRQEATGGDLQVVLDPSRLGRDGSAAVITYAISPDGSLLAYALSHGGSDWQDIRVLYLDSGAEEEYTLSWCKFPSIAWVPDNAGFFYNCYPAPDECADERAQHSSTRVRFHRLGTPQSADPFIFTPAGSEIICTPIVAEDGAYVLIHKCKSTVPDDHLYYRPLESDGTFTPLLPHMEAHFRYIGTAGSTCYLETDLEASKGRVIAVDLASQGCERYRVILPENVRAGVRYPATLIMTAENNLRAVPTHAMKFAAALQAANAGPHPILLCIEPEGGHGLGLAVRHRINGLSKVLAFLLQALVPLSF